MRQVVLTLILVLFIGVGDFSALSAGDKTPKTVIYEVIDLGDMGSSGNSYAEGMNDKTQVVAQIWEFGAALWQDGEMTALPSTGFLSCPYVTSINNSGSATGSCRSSDGRYHTVLWENGTVTSLGSPGNDFNEGMAINDKGQVLARSRPEWGITDWHLIEEGIWTPLATLGWAWDINNKGQIIGRSRDTGVVVMWDENTITPLPGFEGAWSVDPHAVNDDGQVVGTWTGPSLYAFLWQEGVRTDLDLGYYSEALDINDKGQIVGYHIEAAGAPMRAFVWDEGEVIDLEPSPECAASNRTLAVAVNNNGEVAGWASWDDGDGYCTEHPTLWIPVKEKKEK